MIKITYETIGEGLKKPEETTIQIFQGRLFARYNIPGKAEQTVKQMHQDGRKGVLFSRGCLIQIFQDKSEQEILQIVEQDIKNGLYVAEQKSKKKLEIINYKIHNA